MQSIASEIATVPDLNIEHLTVELARIDVLIKRGVHAWQLAGQDPTDAYRGLYVSDAEANALLRRPFLASWGDTVILDESDDQVFREAEHETESQARRIAEAARNRGEPTRLDHLAQVFGLDSFDVDVLLICLAPTLDLRYEKLYGYLQDDVTKKWPSVDLVLNLLCASYESKLAAREHFISDAPLIKYQMLYLFEDQSHPESPLLGKRLKLDERIVNYLLGSDKLDGRILSYTQRIIPRTHLENPILRSDLKRHLRLLTTAGRLNEKGLIFYLHGPNGVGKQSIAAATCQELGKGMLIVDGKRLSKTEDGVLESIMELVIREALLQNALLYWDDFDALLAVNHSLKETLLRGLEHQQGLIFLAGNTRWEPQDAIHNKTFIQIAFSRPTYDERIQLWDLYLKEAAPNTNDLELKSLANKFRLTGGQIQDAVVTACNLARWRDPENGQVNLADLYEACRLHSNHKLTTLAQKIVPLYKWDDIVLPTDRMEQLHEICNYVKHRSQVYDEWGFDRKLSLGKGLNVLFTGPSGTGKTMAAEIIANELGLELYKIDLSMVVNKYIGETEKNLSSIFAEAEASNAILFFDEADALFGKRSEIKDAHDRYANMEISYLLQKMEEYEGVVILSTNLRKNMDDAFVRRMAFTVPFPFPEADDRLRIWQGIWPPETPRMEDLDLAFIARQFKLAGGNIKNVALAAAFLAAEDGQVVGMDHLIWATKREFQKMGKMVVEHEFGGYAEFVRCKTSSRQRFSPERTHEGNKEANSNDP